VRLNAVPTDGELPRKQRRLVQAWIELRREEQIKALAAGAKPRSGLKSA
jgi:hypothetical protein